MYPVSFGVSEDPRAEMLDDIKAAINEDISYRIPHNYMHGAGDTYFSGKMLAKLARILLIADTLPDSVDEDVFEQALVNLREGVEIWMNGSAVSPFVYDRDWGGILNCGCDYNYENGLCHNEYPNCPAVGNVNMKLVSVTVRGFLLC